VCVSGSSTVIRCLITLYTYEYAEEARLWTERKKALLMHS